MNNNNTVTEQIAQTAINAKLGFAGSMVGSFMTFFGALSLVEWTGVAVGICSIIFQIINSRRNAKLVLKQERQALATARYYESRTKRLHEGADSLWKDSI
jgi:hypothetical protein